MSSETITRNDLTNILNEVLPVSSGAEEFTPTPYAGYDNYLSHGIYDKSTNTVRLYLWGYDSANISGSAVLFSIPAQYRPSVNVTAIAIMSTDSVNGVSCFVTINTNGEIKQNFTNYLRRIFIVAEYKLG